ncbi:LOW QUALITY PROTEIN: immunoglobulin superfamily member 22 [Ara ararauna]
MEKRKWVPVECILRSMCQGGPLTPDRTETTERQTAAFENPLPNKVQNFTKNFSGKELKFDHKYEIITSDDGLTHAVKTESFQSSDFEEPCIETGDLVLNTLLFINNMECLLVCANFFLTAACPFPGVLVQFVSDLKNTQTKTKGEAWLECVLASEDVSLKRMKNGVIERSPKCTMKYEGKRGQWKEYKDGKSSLSHIPVPMSSCHITDMKSIWIVRQGAIHKLIDRMGKGCKGRLATASIKVPFEAKPILKVTWLKGGIEVTEEEKVVMEKTINCVKIKPRRYRSHYAEFVKSLWLAFTFSLEILQWKAPKGDGGRQVTHFVMERKMAGEKSWIKVGVVSNYTTFAMEKAEEGKAWFRICTINSEGLIEPLKTEEIFFGESISQRFVEPLRQVSQPQVVDVTKESVPITWNSPALHGGSPVKGYVIEKRRKGSNLCFPVTKEPVQGQTKITTCFMGGDREFGSKVEPGKKRGMLEGTRFKEDGFLEDTDELCVIAVNYVGPGLLSMPSTSHCEGTHRSVCFSHYLMSSFPLLIEETLFKLKSDAPMSNGVRIFLKWPTLDQSPTKQLCFHICKYRRAGRVVCYSSLAVTVPSGLPKMVDFSNSSIFLAWLEPDQEDVMSGYILEMAENTKKWTNCTKISISSTTYTVGGLEKHILNQALNEAGMGEAVELQEAILAMPPSRETCSIHPAGTPIYQLLLSYYVLCFVKGYQINLAQKSIQHPSSAAFLLSTDYCVLKCDVSSATWFTAAEVYSNKYIVTGLLPGMKDFFVIVCNDTGDTDPLDSQEQWYISKDRDATATALGKASKKF